MSYKTTLFKAVESASVVSLDGELAQCCISQARLSLAADEDTINHEFNDQVLVIDGYGGAKARDTTGETVHLRFEMTKPMTEDDL